MGWRGIPLVLLSLAVSPRWTMPVLTLGLFVGARIDLNNIVEPWLYGSNTGVSSMALIVAAVFWTWLWGPLGLVLATPLTVCLVVMGGMFHGLPFSASCSAMRKRSLPPRIATIGCSPRPKKRGTGGSLLKANSLTALYDSVLIPVITAAETDPHARTLDEEQLDHVEQSLRDIVEDLGAARILNLVFWMAKRGPSPRRRFGVSVVCRRARIAMRSPGLCSCICFISKASRPERTGETARR